MKLLNLVFAVTLLLLSGMMPALAENTTETSPSASTISAKTSRFSQSTFGAAQDAAITTYLYAKLASHPDLSSSNLDISTNQGKVTLNGIVDNVQQAREVREIIENTAGVQSVDASQVIISPEESSLYIKMSPATLAETPIISEDQADQPLVLAEKPRVNTLSAVKKPDFELRKQNIKHPLIAQKQHSKHGLRQLVHHRHLNKMKLRQFVGRSRHLAKHSQKAQHLAKHTHKTQHLAQKASGKKPRTVYI